MRGKIRPENRSKIGLDLGSEIVVTLECKGAANELIIARKSSEPSNKRFSLVEFKFGNFSEFQSKCPNYRTKACRSQILLRCGNFSLSLFVENLSRIGSSSSLEIFAISECGRIGKCVNYSMKIETIVAFRRIVEISFIRSVFVGYRGIKLSRHSVVSKFRNFWNIAIQNDRRVRELLRENYENCKSYSVSEIERIRKIIG